MPYVHRLDVLSFSPVQQDEIFVEKSLYFDDELRGLEVDDFVVDDVFVWMLLYVNMVSIDKSV